MTVADRQRGWLTPDFHQNFRAMLVRATAKYHVVVPAYCLMPDHLHLIAAGMTSDADQQLWARAIRRSLNQLLLPRKLQKQAYDHVLRTTETNGDGFAAVIYYVCENPVRARLVGTGSWLDRSQGNGRWPDASADEHQRKPRGGVPRFSRRTRPTSSSA